jgi:hypothetical protein
LLVYMPIKLRTCLPWTKVSLFKIGL